MNWYEGVAESSQNLSIVYFGGVFDGIGNLVASNYSNIAIATILASAILYFVLLIRSRGAIKKFSFEEELQREYEDRIGEVEDAFSALLLTKKLEFDKDSKFYEKDVQEIEENTNRKLEIDEWTIFVHKINKLSEFNLLSQEEKIDIVLDFDKNVNRLFLMTAIIIAWALGNSSKTLLLQNSVFLGGPILPTYLNILLVIATSIFVIILAVQTLNASSQNKMTQQYREESEKHAQNIIINPRTSTEYMNNLDCENIISFYNSRLNIVERGAKTRNKSTMMMIFFSAFLFIILIMMPFVVSINTLEILFVLSLCLISLLLTMIINFVANTGNVSNLVSETKRESMNINLFLKKIEQVLGGYDRDLQTIMSELMQNENTE